jgi:hypothetical protein
VNDLDLCLLANTVYDNPSIIVGNSKVLIVETDIEQIIVWAGSDGLLDFLQDGYAVPAEMEGLGLVHRGMMEYYFTPRSIVLQQAIESPKPKTIVGHSLGADAAHKCAWDFGRIMKINRVVTFGCPKGFSKEAASKCTAPAVNYIHGQDAIPDLPPYFHRPGTDIFMDGDGNPLPCREPRELPLEEIRDRVKDHLLLYGGYIKSLGRYFEITSQSNKAG